MRRFGDAAIEATELGLTMGLTAAGLTVGSLWLGRWLDRRFDIAPYATVLMLLAGLVASQVAIFRLAIRATERLSRDEPHLWVIRSAGSAIALALRALLLVLLPGGMGLIVGVLVSRFITPVPALPPVLLALGSMLGLWGAVHMVRRSAILPRADE